MKIYRWMAMAILVVCLGCGGGESTDKPAGDQGKASQDVLENWPISSKQEGTGTDATSKAGSSEGKLPQDLPVDMKGMTPEKVLSKMVAAYKKAASYTDQGEITLKADVPGKNGAYEPFSLAFAMAVSMERPNRVAIRANKGIAICDGRTLHEYAELLPDQLIQKPAPEKISIESIFSDPILADFMANGPSQYYTWIPIQMILLCADKPLNTLLYDVKSMKMLEPAMLEGRSCYRVAIERTDGQGVFWIDMQSFTLRRFEYPQVRLQKDFLAGRSKNLKVSIDFRSAELDGKIDPKLFTFQPPQKIRIVEKLVPYHFDLLGKPAADFFFDTADGNPVTMKSLSGKTVVIHFWAAWNLPCRESLTMMNQIAKRYQDDPRVVFLACNTDQKTVQREDLKKMFTEMNFSLPLFLDSQNFAQNGFKISGVPTTIVIDPRGIVQAYLIGADFDQSFMKEIIQSVAEGKNLYQQAMEEFNHGQRYCQEVFRRMLDDDLFIDPNYILQQVMPLSGVAGRTNPKHSEPVPLWNCRELGLVGNILVFNDTVPPRIFICHDARAIAEVDSQGKVIKDYPFAIPDTAAITNVRAGKTATGEPFYVGFAPSFKQCFLMDKTFTVRWKFPESIEQAAPDGIADVQIADLTGDGTPEILVGYRGIAGVKALSLRGQPIWSSREVTGITKMAVLPATPTSSGVLLCTSDKHSLVGLDGKGAVVKKFDLGGRLLYWITATSPDSTGKVSLCGLSAPGVGKNEAIGIGPDGSLLWAYQLPDGAPGAIIDRIVSGRALPIEERQWILLGADSSIHILSESGKPIDLFNYGLFAAGIATAPLGPHQALLISSTAGVEAFALQPHQKN